MKRVIKRLLAFFLVPTMLISTLILKDYDRIHDSSVVHAVSVDLNEMSLNELFDLLETSLGQDENEATSVGSTVDVGAVMEANMSINSDLNYVRESGDYKYLLTSFDRAYSIAGVSPSERTSKIIEAIKDKIEDMYGSTIPLGFVSINEKVEYFKNKKAINIDVNIQSADFSNSSFTYNHNLAIFCSQLVVLGYTEKSSIDKNISNEDVLLTALETLKFKHDNIDIELNTSSEEVNYFIASQSMNVSDQSYNLIITGFIGSHYGQWYNNFMPGNKATHQGFLKASDFIYKKLEKHIEKRNYSKENTIILVTGHSRGAAIANLISSKLIDEQNFAYADNVYTYAFATPNSTTKHDRNSLKYCRIFNIVNPEDFVTKVMPNEWGNGRYGVTLVLPSKTNTSKYKIQLKEMKEYFKVLTAGETYYPYDNGEETTYNIVKKFTRYVITADDYYCEKGYVDGVAISPFNYFQNIICPLVGEKETNDKMLSAFVLLATSALSGTTTSPYDDFSRFFLSNAVLEKVNKMPEASAVKVLSILSPVLSVLKLYLETSKPYFEDAHRAETYCAYLKTMSEDDLWEYKSAYKNTVNCPVDIEVYDNNTGEIVGKIKNNEVDKKISEKDNSIVMSVEEDSKNFWLPHDGNYKVLLVGNDNGRMDYTVSHIDSDTGEKGRLNFFDVEIDKNICMEGTFSSKDFVFENYILNLNDSPIIEPSEKIKDEMLKDKSVSIIVEGKGIATDSFVATSGDFVTVTANNTEDECFVGWYENNTIVSNDIEYSFVLKENRKLIAKFDALNIPTPSTTTINYGDKIVLHANIEGELPAGYQIKWISSNNNFGMSVSADGKSCTISPESSGETVFTAVIVDENDNAVSSDEQTMTSKAGFFQKIIAFFKKLFGLTKTIPQSKMF